MEEIERRAHAAGKAPWQSFIEGRDHCGGDNFVRIGSLKDDEPDMYVSRAVGSGEEILASDTDLDFIAHTRQDMPRLIAEIRRLRTEQKKGHTDE